MLTISIPHAVSAQDPTHIERVEQSLWGYLAMLEEYQSSRYSTLRDACMGQSSVLGTVVPLSYSGVLSMQIQYNHRSVAINHVSLPTK